MQPVADERAGGDQRHEEDEEARGRRRRIREDVRPGCVLAGHRYPTTSLPTSESASRPRTGVVHAEAAGLVERGLAHLARLLLGEGERGRPGRLGLALRLLAVAAEQPPDRSDTDVRTSSFAASSTTEARNLITGTTTASAYGVSIATSSPNPTASSRPCARARLGVAEVLLGHLGEEHELLRGRVLEAQGGELARQRASLVARHRIGAHRGSDPLTPRRRWKARKGRIRSPLRNGAAAAPVPGT